MKLDYEVDSESITIYVVSTEEPPKERVSIKIEDPQGNILIDTTEKFDPPDPPDWNFWIASLFREILFEKGKHTISVRCGEETMAGSF